MPPLAPIRNHYNYQRNIGQQTSSIQSNQIQVLKEKPEEDARLGKVV